MTSDPAGFEGRSGLAAQFARQARDCADIGSGVYADICRSASLELASGGPLAALLQPWSDARDGDLIPLRVLAAAHRLVLEREAPALALWFPSVGGTAPVDGAGRGSCYEAWQEALRDNASRLPVLLSSPPQTNEPARSAAFTGAFSIVSEAYRLPLHVHEVGASAGLNLLADRVRITWLGGARGPQGSPLVLEDAWTGDPLPPDVAPDIVARVAVDLAPVDVTTTEGRLHLTSFVWPDQTERFERLRAAYELAATVPVELVRADVVDHLRSLEPVPGRVLVVAHSTTWIYLDEPARAAAEVAFQQLASHAGPEAPVVHLSREPHALDERAGLDFDLILRCWPAPLHGPLAAFPAGTSLLVGCTSAHGLPVRWQPPTETAITAL